MDAAGEHASDGELNLGEASALAAAASDAALARLLLSIPREAGPKLIAVRATFAREQHERAAREAVFAPLRPRASAGPRPAPPYLTDGASLVLWRLARSESPDACDALVRAAGAGLDGPGLAARQNALCAALAELLSDPPTAAAREAVLMLECAPGQSAVVIGLLALASELRAAIPGLGVWTHQLTQQSASEVRAAFAAAAQRGELASARFTEALAAHLPEPWQALRLVALVHDRPTDATLAGGPFSSILQALIGDIGYAAEKVRAFDPAEGAAAGSALGSTVRNAVQILSEFDQWVETARSGAWGARLAADRKALALGVEAQLKAAARLFADALPTRALRWTQRSEPRAPALAHDPDRRSAESAEGIAALIAGLRTTPSSSGFATLRAKITGQLEQQLDAYTEAAIALLHRASSDERPRLRAYLDVAARVAQALGGEPAGLIVRRRAAAA